MPTLMELRNRYQKVSGASSDARGEVMECDTRGSLSPSEVVNRKLQLTLESHRASRADLRRSLPMSRPR